MPINNNNLLLLYSFIHGISIGLGLYGVCLILKGLHITRSFLTAEQQRLQDEETGGPTPDHEIFFKKQNNRNYVVKSGGEFVSHDGRHGGPIDDPNKPFHIRYSAKKVRSPIKHRHIGFQKGDVLPKDYTPTNRSILGHKPVSV